MTIHRLDIGPDILHFKHKVDLTNTVRSLISYKKVMAYTKNDKINNNR